jgi:hypothetical protein
VPWLRKVPHWHAQKSCAFVDDQAGPLDLSSKTANLDLESNGYEPCVQKKKLKRRSMPALAFRMIGCGRLQVESFAV